MVNFNVHLFKFLLLLKILTTLTYFGKKKEKKKNPKQYFLKTMGQEGLWAGADSWTKEIQESKSLYT